MKALVVFGGRFQPFHKGHKASYDYLSKKFGSNSVIIASADKAQGPKDPFSWEEKKRIAVATGIPANKFIQIKNIYSAKHIHDTIPFDRNNTVIILAVSQKDGNRLVGTKTDEEGYAIKNNGGRSTIQWLKGKKPQAVISGHMYAVVTPTVTFSVAGQKVIAATEIRKLYATADNTTRNAILHDLYDNPSTHLRRLFDKRLDIVKTESLLREFVEFLYKF